MTKQEKIKDAWGDAYETVKGFLGDNGYIHTVDLAHSNLNISSFGLDLTYNDIGVRPKSLVGIHKNNGWIKIESEEDFPNETGCYHVINKKGRYFRKNFLKHLKNKKEKWKNITHYQPIEKPEPPIY